MNDDKKKEPTHGVKTERGKQPRKQKSAQQRGAQARGPNQPSGKAVGQKTKRSDFRWKAGDKLNAAVSDLAAQADGAKDAAREIATELADLKKEINEDPPKQSPAEGDKKPENRPFDPKAHFAEKPARFWWDESWTVQQVRLAIFLAGIVCVFLLLKMWFFFTVPFGLFCLKWVVSRLPKRHVIVPIRPKEDHVDDRRPDVHRMLKASRPAQYFEWREIVMPVPLAYLHDILRWQRDKYAPGMSAIWTLMDSWFINDPVLALLFTALLELSLRWATWFNRYWRAMIFVANLLSRWLPFRAILYLIVCIFVWICINGLHRDINQVQYILTYIVTLAALTGIELLWLCHRSTLQRDLLVSNNVVKQLSVLKCCNPLSEAGVVRERMIQFASTLCSVNFDESLVLEKNRIAEDSVRVAFSMYMDARRRNSDFLEAL